MDAKMQESETIAFFFRKANKIQCTGLYMWSVGSPEATTIATTIAALLTCRTNGILGYEPCYCPFPLLLRFWIDHHVHRLF